MKLSRSLQEVRPSRTKLPSSSSGSPCSPPQPIAELTLLYTRQDLDTEVIAEETIDSGTTVAIQGQYQVVRSTSKTHVYAAQITEVVHVVRLDVALLTVPYLQPGTLWMREDALVELQAQRFTVDNVSPRSHLRALHRRTLIR